MITIGSLFDGISGFPLAGQRNGMTALWASEIEPFPIKVTKIRFPNMKHLGDITKIDCNNLEPVDIVTGGSPCQDLSVAGKRAGLAGARSGLFMEQIRIVRELREIDKRNGRTGVDIRPRFMVWENVPGAFSSNKGEDFRAVLEETARIADETAVIPGPPKGKWNTAGCIMGNSWSIAWRVLDAQYWGVPQRRRRIFLVADFGGQSAPEILFKRKGLSRYSQESGETREGTASDAEGSIGKASGADIYNLKLTGDTACTLNATSGGSSTHSEPAVVAIDSNCQDSRFKLTGQVVPTIPAKAGTGGNNGPMLAVAYGICSYASNSMKSDNPHSGIYEAETSRTIDLNGGSPACNQGGMAIVQCVEPGALSRGQGERVWDKCPTLRANMGDNQPCVVLNDQEGSQMDVSENVVGTLRAEMHGNIPAVTTYSFQRSDEFKETDKASTQSRRQYKDATDLVCSVDCRNFNETDKHGTLQAKGNGGQSLNYMGAVREGYSVRRLTPLECERLQGFPDGWTDIPGQTEATEQELEFWRDVWLTWDKTQAEDPEKVKPRTDKAILKWLKNPTSDSAQYKALGNSVAIPCVEYVLEGIKEAINQ